MVIAAAAAVAWFGLLAVQSHATDAATAIVALPRVTPAQGRHAAALLSTAATLDPGQEITILRSKLAFARGDVGAARRLAAAAAHAELGNPQAWLALVDVSKGTSELAPAFRHLISLVPPVSGG